MPGFFILAVVFFGLSAWSRWWSPAPSPRPYYPALVSLGLLFLTLALGGKVIWALF